MTHIFHPSILRAYDIRGIYQQGLNEEDAYAIGRALATYLDKKDATITVCRDGRLSSPQLSQNLVQGLMDSGINVIDIGIGPSPLLYFAQKHLNADAGVMVTGSHNPGHYNGFKICLSTGPFFGEDIQTLAKIAASGNWISGDGSVCSQSVQEEYIARLMQDLSQHYTINNQLTIAWDPGNGSAGDIVTQLVKHLPGVHYVINAHIDGNFPNHHPDPSVEENLVQLRRLVNEKNCDFGIAFDGDGDRIGLIDSTGDVVWGDMLVAMFAEEVLQQHPDAPIILDVKSSQVVVDWIKKLGGKPVLYRTGHSYIKAHMKEINSPLAGELSGHMFFADRYYGFDDALYAAVRLIGRFSQDNLTVQQWLSQLPKSYISPELAFESTSEEKFKVIEKIAQRLRDEQKDFLAIDGVRVSTEHGWWLVRASNTQDILVARVESSSAQGLEVLKQMLMQYLHPLGVK